MRRHQALVPLSHDHHHGLAQARRLRRAASEADPERLLQVARGFVEFFAREGAGHFRDEEELLFPLLADCGDPATSLLAEIAVQHAAVRSLVGQVRRSVQAGRVEAEVLNRLGELLEQHIRLEERQLFPLIEEIVTDEDLEGLLFPSRTLEPVGEGSPVVNLTSGQGNGPLWGTASEDLNATLLAWDPGETLPEQVNDQRDVLIVGIEGTGEVQIDGQQHAFGPGRSVLIEKGSKFRITAGSGGLRYLSVHLRRTGGSRSLPWHAEKSAAPRSYRRIHPGGLSCSNASSDGSTVP